MTLNERIFFKMNALVGRSRLLDVFGWAGAEIAIFASLSLFFSEAFTRSQVVYKGIPALVAVGALCWALGWVINLGIATVVREPRPHTTYPQSRLLVRPLATRWKSFPSDHAMTSWLFYFLALATEMRSSGFLLGLAVWISWGRVYVGVHYPKDIVAGVFVAALVALASLYWVN